MSGHLRVLAPGLSTTVQDAGRTGWQRFGVPVSGALDRLALAAANTVAGNAPGEAALEMLYQGASFLVEADALRIAVAGGGSLIDITRDEGTHRVAALESVTVARGDIIKITLAGPGIAAYLAVLGGFDVPVVMGSRSTYARAGIGGLDGRPLKRGDLLGLTSRLPSGRGEMTLGGVRFDPPSRLRVVLGPQDDYFTPAALATFLGSVYRVAPASDRMGARLTGARLAHASGFDIVSDGIAPGAIQVPGDGLPIILLSDRQTTGGYPKIATVISADLPAVGRLAPGSDIRFVAVTLTEAEAARRAQDRDIATWAGRLRPVASMGIDVLALAEANLISGTVNADGPFEHHPPASD